MVVTLSEVRRVRSKTLEEQCGNKNGTQGGSAKSVGFSIKFSWGIVRGSGERRISGCSSRGAVVSLSDCQSAVR